MYLISMFMQAVYEASVLKHVSYFAVFIYIVQLLVHAVCSLSQQASGTNLSHWAGVRVGGIAGEFGDILSRI